MTQDTLTRLPAPGCGRGNDQMEWQSFRLPSLLAADMGPVLEALAAREQAAGWSVVGVTYSSHSESFYMVLERPEPGSAGTPGSH